MTWIGWKTDILRSYSQIKGQFDAATYQSFQVRASHFAYPPVYKQSSAQNHACILC